ncbi:hypothetical protein EW146_g6432 [Bondarzewia mesenterica]|uniref:BTB domain-containing protein n=1 Tax=Bondarzewia mesenterica TaxID=1095465 RepID=A0A4S4LQM8_9AGAM|nr:hypothetical protein EW146_g6432 [Bondarzewia mesenterica]
MSTTAMTIEASDPQHHKSAFGNDTEDKRTQRHPVFWFDDGSLLVPLSSSIFNIHRSLLTRHSQTCSSWITAMSDPTISSRFATFSDMSPTAVLAVPSHINVTVADFEVLLEHLYHDARAQQSSPLGPKTPYPRLASILRTSSPKQLHLSSIYLQACTHLGAIFPGRPASFTHQHPTEHLEDALELAMQFDIGMQTKKALLYSVTASTNFDPSGAHDPAGVPSSDPSDISQSSASPHAALSTRTLRICHRFLSSLISDFTPLLFTVGATSHMGCTDILADCWMDVVISPALADGGVGRPLETLQRMADWDWEKEGICESCAKEKRQEWAEEARGIWQRMGGWIIGAENAEAATVG